MKKEQETWTSQAGPETYWVGSLESFMVAKSPGGGGTSGSQPVTAEK